MRPPFIHWNEKPQKQFDQLREINFQILNEMVLKFWNWKKKMPKKSE